MGVYQHPKQKKDIFVWATDDQIKELDDIFKRAAKTDRRLPPVRMKRIAAAWLDMKVEKSAYGYDPSAKITIRPDASDLDNYDKALEIGLKLPLEHRQLIWAVATQWAIKPYGTWTRVGRQLNCTRQTVMNRYRGALQYAYIVNKMQN